MIIPTVSDIPAPVHVKEQSDEQDRRGTSGEEKVNADAPAEAKTHTAEDVRNLSRKRMGVCRNRQRAWNTAQMWSSKTERKMMRDEVWVLTKAKSQTKSPLVGGLEHFLFFHILGIIKSQLTNIFRGLKPTTSHAFWHWPSAVAQAQPRRFQTDRNWTDRRTVSREQVNLCTFKCPTIP